MTDDPHLRDLLDSSIGDGPAAPSPADRLRPAKRALRRRRLASGSGVVGAVAAVAVTAALLTGPGGGPTAVEPAGGPTPTPAVEPTPAPVPEAAVEPDRHDRADRADLADCLAAISGLTGPGPELDYLDEDLGIEYDPRTGRFVLPRESVKATIGIDGDLSTMTCTIEGVPVEIEPVPAQLPSPGRRRP